ncbi:MULTISPECIES: LuxR family transcriptional regulator [unclassified Rhizobium]|uniref:helix-turn-helix transcriptional regulator n=1 Tax=unclassified Rhizobium TaxID=2613769 RepID=UPI000646A60F|nr:MULTISPECIES: LuxR family transcriptional regulator [unclassified Rhizobium]MBN8952715.1 LuxR family transcriptional regulator [Rhizobium tropici]OJY71387.1 MAG: LuxR family transcriptional regulator [Rhizobium sp. 60-20]RKD55206.1 LuxR family transcriptional regulator [Rhizobium sp. WW_1]
MNIHSLIQLLVVIEECKLAKDVVAEFELVLRSYKFDFYGVLKQTRPNIDVANFILAGRWPDQWPLTYVRKRYMLVDPIARYSTQAQRPFRWSDAVAALKTDPLRRRMEQMMADARANGLIDGYLFPIHGRNGMLGSMTIGGEAVDLSPTEISVFDAVARKIFWRLLELRDEAQSFEGAGAADLKLTKREMEVLNHLADGMTSIEISRLLAISNHTVDWYMNSIQDKLKARNRQHIVAIAFRNGLIP